MSEHAEICLLLLTNAGMVALNLFLNHCCNRLSKQLKQAHGGWTVALSLAQRWREIAEEITQDKKR